MANERHCGVTVNRAAERMDVHDAQSNEFNHGGVAGNVVPGNEFASIVGNLD
jgi:hypothetical protein